MSLSRVLHTLAVVGCLAVASSASARANPAAAAASAGEVVLLNFSAPWCGPCRQMAPLIGEISAAGWVVRHVDVDREGDVVKRFAVTGVPCYVLLVKGEEVGRINGATTRGELEALLHKSRSPLGVSAPPIAAATTAPRAGIPLTLTPAAAPLATDASPRAASTGPAVLAGEATLDRRSREQTASAPQPRPGAVVAEPPVQLDPARRQALEHMLMAATARLLVEDGQGVSRGTGTVIDCRQGEALILTCGHIFRDSQGRGRIEVDLFGGDAARGIAGQVVAWDLKRDLALVSIFTDKRIEPVRVGAAGRTTVTGESVVSVGCNGGDDPTIHHSRVTAVDKYLGPANVQVAGQPVQGRSGGGLFALDGTLIGVCNAADPADNEGLFAALPSIHEQLDEAGLAFVYRSVYPSGGPEAVALAAGPTLPSMPAEMPAVSFDRRDRADALPTASTGATSAGAALPAAPAANGPPDPRRPVAAAQKQALSPGEQALVDHVWKHDDQAEVICIVRPRGSAAAPSEVFVLQGTSRDFVEQLSKANSATTPIHHAPPKARSDMAALPTADVVR